MKKEIIKINGIMNQSYPFNYVVKAGNFLFLTSQLSVDLKTNKILNGNVIEQTTQTMDNIKFLLESSGTNMDNILKVVIYMKNLKDFESMNQVYRKYFKKGLEPARVTIQATSPIKDIDIEIEVTALLPEFEN